jgi:hypothetical protein
MDKSLSPPPPSHIHTHLFMSRYVFKPERKEEEKKKKKPSLRRDKQSRTTAILFHVIHFLISTIHKPTCPFLLITGHTNHTTQL